MESILRLPAVKARTGLSRSTVYQFMSRNQFPQPVHLGSRAIGWLESEIEDWIAGCSRLSDCKATHTSN